MKKITLIVILSCMIAFITGSCSKSCKCYSGDDLQIDYGVLASKTDCQDINNSLTTDYEICKWD